MFQIVEITEAIWVSWSNEYPVWLHDCKYSDSYKIRSSTWPRDQRTYLYVSEYTLFHFTYHALSVRHNKFNSLLQNSSRTMQRGFYKMNCLLYKVGLRNAIVPGVCSTQTQTPIYYGAKPVCSLHMNYSCVVGKRRQWRGYFCRQRTQRSSELGSKKKILFVLTFSVTTLRYLFQTY